MPVSSYITPKARKGTASAIEGRGLIAVAPIAAGELVAIKGGHIITTAALHSLPERLRNSEIQIADGFHLAALEEAEYEPVMLFLNHSCEPNVGFAGNTVLVAMRDIAPGEELTTDYALFDDHDETMRCRCGSRSCRGTISGRDWQRPDLQRKYGDYFSTYLLRRFAIRPDPGSPPGGGLLSPPSLVAKAASARPSCTCGSDASRRGRTPESAPAPLCDHRSMGQTSGQDGVGQQIAAAMAAEHESLSPECRADAARLERLLAPDFHEFGASGAEFGYEGTATRVAAATDPDGEPITVAGMRGWLLADGLVMLKYTSEFQGRRAHRTSLWRRTPAGRWQIFHHQGTLTGL